MKLADGKERSIRYIASTTYWLDGKPVSAMEFLRRLFGDLSKLIADEDTLRNVWSDPDKREHFLDQLSDLGYEMDRLDDIRRLVDAPDSDLFDVLSYVLFDLPPKTRQERAESVSDGALEAFEDELRSLLIGILNAYVRGGESELRTDKLGRYLTARYGSVSEGKSKLGGDLRAIKDAYKRMQASPLLELNCQSGMTKNVGADGCA